MLILSNVIGQICSQDIIPFFYGLSEIRLILINASRKITRIINYTYFVFVFPSLLFSTVVTESNFGIFLTIFSSASNFLEIYVVVIAVSSTRNSFSSD